MMSCGDALIRRAGKRALYKAVTDPTYYRVVNRIAERLGEGFRIIDTWLEDVVTAVAEVVRTRDGKHYLAIYDIPSDVLELRARG